MSKDDKYVGMLHQVESEKAISTWKQHQTEEVQKLKKASNDVLLKDIRNQRFKGTRLVDLAAKDAKERKNQRQERLQHSLTPLASNRQMTPNRNSQLYDFANRCQTKLASNT